jgi:ectoine hydroxylase-related dioxygenase (phytanoyl-CoA dioxygenase family)
MLTISDESSFQRDGYLLLRSVFSPEEIQTAKAACKEREAHADASGVHVLQWHALPAPLRDVACDRRLTAPLNQLIGPQIELLSAKLVFKSGAVRFASPWHQDHAYWHGSTKYSVWIALEHATAENGCLKVIPGSHSEQVDHQHVDSDVGFGNRVGEEAINESESVTVPMEAGDALVFHDCMLHSSHPNVSGQDRWAFIPTYRDATVPDDSSVWESGMPIEGCGMAAEIPPIVAPPNPSTVTSTSVVPRRRVVLGVIAVSPNWH